MPPAAGKGGAVLGRGVAAGVVVALRARDDRYQVVEALLVAGAAGVLVVVPIVVGVLGSVLQPLVGLQRQVEAGPVIDDEGCRLGERQVEEMSARAMQARQTLIEFQNRKGMASPQSTASLAPRSPSSRLPAAQTSATVRVLKNTDGKRSAHSPGPASRAQPATA